MFSTKKHSCIAPLIWSLDVFGDCVITSCDQQYRWSRRRAEVLCEASDKLSLKPAGFQRNKEHLVWNVLKKLMIGLKKEAGRLSVDLLQQIWGHRKRITGFRVNTSRIDSVSLCLFLCLCTRCESIWDPFLSHPRVSLSAPAPPQSGDPLILSSASETLSICFSLRQQVHPS